MPSTITKTNFDWARYIKDHPAVAGYFPEKPINERAWAHYQAEGLKAGWKAYGVGEGEVTDYLQRATDQNEATKAMDNTFIDLVGKMNAANEPLMAGEIPDDVRAQIEQTTAEQSLSRGLGEGSAARNLTARDLGRSSLDIKQQGIANAATIAQLAESRRQFDKQFTNNLQQFTDTIRKTGLSQSALEQTRIQFNATQALEVNKMIKDLAIAGAEITFNYQAKGMSSATFDTSLTSYLNQMKSLLNQ